MVCYVVPYIAEIFKDNSISNITDPAITSLSLNEPLSQRQGKIDILLGTPHFWQVVKGVSKRLNSKLVVLDTVFGDVLCGSTSDVVKDIALNAITSDKLNKKFEKLWQLEFFPRDDSESKLTMDEIAAVESIEKNLVFLEEKQRFQTRLLWKGKPDLKNNYAAAKVRLESLMRKLRKNSDLKAAYKSVIQEFIDMQTVESVKHDSLASMKDPSRTDLYFLPHRAVYDPLRVTTKCRVVMDASAKTPSGKSLNDCLLPGPPLQQQIVAVELRFRRRAVALIGDCKKMFLQIEVHPVDRPFLRFLWHDPDDMQAVPKVYQFRTLIFGAADSPFQAISCFQRLVSDLKQRGNLTNLEKRVCETILNDTYVDDVTTGGDDVEEAYSMYTGLTKVMARAHFKIHKWATNSPELLSMIPEKERAPNTINEETQLLESDETSSLGIRWDPGTDRLTFRRYAGIGLSNEDTKTSVASLLAKPFDPLGLISPYILLARKILKGTFENKMGWKQKLTDDLLKDWQKWVSQLPELNKFLV